MTAQTILNQLGGNRFVAMTGAKNFCALTGGLQFRFPGSKAANSCVIKLNAKDLYDIEFYKVQGLNCARVIELQDIGAEQLRETFEAKTGLAISL